MTKSKYMMARAWVHNFTDFKRQAFSSDDPTCYDLCYVEELVGNAYAGEFWRGGWVFGMGLINVFFPVADTRPATEAEKDQLCGGLVHSTFADPYKLDRANFS